MFKKISLAAITSLSLNATDIVSLNEFQINYTNAQTEIKEFHSKIMQKEEEQIIDLGESAIKSIKSLKDYNYKTIDKNIDNWIVKESEKISEVINIVLKHIDKEYNLAKKLARQSKKIPFINKIDTEICQLWKDMKEDTLKYKRRIEDAKYVNDFMLEFIPKNEKVLKALA